MAPGRKTGGRKKGTPNKTSKIVDDVLQAFKTVGGQAWLVKLAEEDKRSFVQLLGKIIPTNIQGPEDDGSFIVKIVKFKND